MIAETKYALECYNSALILIGIVQTMNLYHQFLFLIQFFLYFIYFSVPMSCRERQNVSKLTGARH